MHQFTYISNFLLLYHRNGEFDEKSTKTVENIINYYKLSPKIVEKICNENNKCNLGITKDLYLTIGYDTNGYEAGKTTYNIDLNYSAKIYLIIDSCNTSFLDAYILINSLTIMVLLLLTAHCIRLHTRLVINTVRYCHRW